MLRLAENVRSTHSADGSVVLDIRRGRMFRFNPTGSRMLDLLSSGTEEKEIAHSLVAEFSADPEVARADTGAFIAVLRQHRLIEP